MVLMILEVSSLAVEIAAMASVLSGNVDQILITGGLANSDRLVDWIKARTGFIAPVAVFSGENELEALAMGALRVLKGDEDVKRY